MTIEPEEHEAHPKEGSAEVIFDPDCAPGLQPSIQQAEASREALPDEPGGPTFHDYFGLADLEEETFKFCFATKDGLLSRAGNISFRELGQFMVRERSGGGVLIAPLFTVVGTGVDPRTGEHARVIEFRDDYRHVCRVVIPLSVIHQGGHQLTGFLGSKGFRASVSKRARAILQGLLTMVPGPRLHIASGTGWVPGVKELVFVTPHGIIGNTDTTRIVADSGVFANVKIGKAGTYQDWRDSVAARARDNSRLTLAVSVSFASPLLRFASTVTPTCVHIFGESSTGKTTALVAAGSVWGGCESDPLGYGHSWNATSNYNLAIAGAHSDTLLTLDELRLATAQDVVKAAYMFAGGQGRGRLTKDAQRRSTDRFRTMVLSSGELTMDELERQAVGSKRQAFAGAEMRLPSIPADAGQGFGLFEDIHKFRSPARFADALQSTARTHYGHAGPRFIEKLIEEIKEVGEDGFRRDVAAMVREFTDSIELDEDADDAVRRLLRTFGLIATAGQLACRWKILPLSEDDIAWGVETCFKAWIKARGGARSKTSNTALIELRDFLQQNVGRFAPVAADELPRIQNVAGYVETKDNSTTYYILLPVWKHEIISKAPRAKLIEALDELELLIRTRGSADDTIVKKVRALGKSVRAYAVDGAILALTDQGTLEAGSTAPAASNGRVANLSEYRKGARSSVNCVRRWSQPAH